MSFRTQISYADLERMGWPQHLINDYMGRIQDFSPQYGTDSDPNGIYVANMNGFYVDTATPGLWFSPVPDSDSEWIQIV
jgi:hypothetical protein